MATVAGTNTTYHHPDHLSIRAETDSTGTVTNRSGTLPYGDFWYGGSSDKLTFTSYPRDNGTGETGLDYAMFRHYNSGQGRFMSVDLLGGRLGVPQSLNRYPYAGGDPINRIDPFGLEPLTCAPGYTRIYNGNGPGHCVLDPEPQAIPPEEAPGKSGGTFKAPVDLKALGDCLKELFNIALVSFEAVSQNSAGTFVGKTADGKQLNFATDGKTFTSEDLSRINRIKGGGDVTGLTLDGFTQTRGNKYIFLGGARFITKQVMSEASLVQARCSIIRFMNSLIR